MTLVNSAGTQINQGSFPKTAGNGYPNANDAFYTIDSDVYETFQLDGESGKTGKRLKYKAGQVVQLSELNALYPTPTISSFSPATGLATAGGTVITATGTNLDGVSAVTVGGTAATAVSVSANGKTLTFTTPAKTAGTYTVVATDDSGTLTKTNALTFA